MISVVDQKINVIAPYWCDKLMHINENWIGCRGVRGMGLGLAISISLDLREDEFWIHVAVSRQRRTPSYEDLVLVKRDFFGGDREAYQKFPKTKESVNFHPYCLHLWSPLDGRRITPDFCDKDGLI